jgi:ketosteroid isomerase-like protein
VTAARTLVLKALDAIADRDWDRLASTLHEDVVHLTPGVPAPVVGRHGFVQMSRDAVLRTPDVRFDLERLVEEGLTVVVVGEWRYTGPAGPVRQPSVSVVEIEDGLIRRDTEYFGLAM